MLKWRVLLISTLSLSALTLAEGRDAAQVRAFRKLNPCPATQSIKGACPGYVVDHIYPLCAGGVDNPSNMQWQPKPESILKDKWEWALCRRLKREHQGD